MSNPICDLFGIRYPLLMGGITPKPELGAAISNAGGLGCIEGVMPADGLREAIQRFRTMSDKPFSINFPLAQGTPEMTALCRGLFQEGAWFVTGEGEIDARAYEHVLKPRGLVTIKGIGETYSGVYYVSYVRHTFTCESYAQYFRVRRDALLPTGDEVFSSNGSLGGLL